MFIIGPTQHTRQYHVLHAGTRTRVHNVHTHTRAKEKYDDEVPAVPTADARPRMVTYHNDPPKPPQVWRDGD